MYINNCQTKEKVFYLNLINNQSRSRSNTRLFIVHIPDACQISNIADGQHFAKHILVP